MYVEIFYVYTVYGVKFRRSISYTDIVQNITPVIVRIKVFQLFLFFVHEYLILRSAHVISYSCDMHIRVYVHKTKYHNFCNEKLV